MGDHAYAHVPVMAGRVTELLAARARPGPAPGGRPPVLVDATLGRAGHARALLEACPGLLLIGIDADEAAIAAGRDLAAEYPGRVTVAHAFYDQIAAIVAGGGDRRIQGVLFDLGVSSPQLDDTGRGFSYSHDAPLDMRMDQSAEQTAERIVNSYPAADLARVLSEYGEERFARRIADVHRAGAGPRAGHQHAAAGRHRQGRDPGGRQAHRRQPRQAYLPGTAHRGERRARRAAPGAARRARPARARRPARRAGLPLARGPAGQAGTGRRGRPTPPRPGCRSAPPTWQSGGPRVPPADPGRRAPGRRRAAINPRSASAASARSNASGTKHEQDNSKKRACSFSGSSGRPDRGSGVSGERNTGDGSRTMAANERQEDDGRGGVSTITRVSAIARPGVRQRPAAAPRPAPEQGQGQGQRPAGRRAATVPPGRAAGLRRGAQAVPTARGCPTSRRCPTSRPRRARGRRRPRPRPGRPRGSAPTGCRSCCCCAACSAARSSPRW